MGRNVSRERLTSHPLDVAPTLLNAELTSRVDGERVVARIVEVEAYGGVGQDPGSHAFSRHTPRNATMFERPGLAYVYFTYGMHFCLNVVCHAPGEAGAVLIRAAEVIEGIDVARRRRPDVRDRDLARGPARLTVALAVDATHDGVDLLAIASPLILRFADDPVPPRGIEVGPRTGVGGDGAHRPWRFRLRDDPFVSPYRGARPR
jgi:DNA-3-methyladenine glycosylase